MSFAARQELLAFKSVTRTHTSGRGTETVPNGAVQVVITVQASGAVGFVDTGANLGYGGGAGSASVKTSAVHGGNTLAYVMGDASSTGANPAANATVSGTLAGGAVSITAVGGRSATGGGAATATGGDTNYTGPAGQQAMVAASGGVAHFGTPGNGGSANGFAPPGNPGVQGFMTFVYT